MFPEDQNLDQATPAEESSEQPKKKRNCGRTGPTTDAGKFNSSQNARKHGACARTLILPVESEQGWRILLSRFEDQYQPREESLEHDFVLRTAQAEWFRLRTVRQYDEFLLSTHGLPPFQWTPEQLKMHDLMLRYRNSAERSFHRELHALEAYYKTRKLTPAKKQEEQEPEQAQPPVPKDSAYLANREQIAEYILQRRTPMSSAKSDTSPQSPDREDPTPESE